MFRKSGVLPPTLILAVAVLGCATPPGPDPAAPPPPTSAEAGGQTIVAIAPPSAPQQTLPQWLGVNDLFGALGGLTRAKHRLMAPLFPQMARQMLLNEPPPLLKSITDPENLKEDAPPVVQAAAEAQMDEQAAEQKIAAIEALAKIGCVRGHPAVEEGLLASLSDPTERVRFAAVSALADLAGSPCEVCQSGSCCSPKIYAKLAEMAEKKTDTNCWFEPSGRVRRVARRAMISCGPSSLPKPKPLKIEGPPKDATPPKPGIEGPETAPPPPAVKSASLKPQSPSRNQRTPMLTPIAKRKPVTGSPAVKRSAKTDAKPVSLQSKSAPSPKTSAATIAPVSNNDDSSEIRIRWEHVVAPVGNFTSRGRARRAIEYFRNRAIGVRSRRPNDWDPKRFQIRVHGWTAESSIAPEKLARLIRALPVGRVSVIIEDRDAFHMVRVLERRLPKTTSQPDTQPRPGTPTASPDSLGPAWELSDPRLPKPDRDFPLPASRPDPVSGIGTSQGGVRRASLGGSPSEKPTAKTLGSKSRSYQPRAAAKRPRRPIDIGKPVLSARPSPLRSLRTTTPGQVFRNGTPKVQHSVLRRPAAARPMPVKTTSETKAVSKRPPGQPPIQRRPAVTKRFPLRRTSAASTPATRSKAIRTPTARTPAAVIPDARDAATTTRRRRVQARPEPRQILPRRIQRSSYNVPSPVTRPAARTEPRSIRRPHTGVTQADYQRSGRTERNQMAKPLQRNPATSPRSRGTQHDSARQTPASLAPAKPAPARSELSRTQSARKPPGREASKRSPEALFSDTVHVWNMKGGSRQARRQPEPKRKINKPARKPAPDSPLNRAYDRVKFGQWNDR